MDLVINILRHINFTYTYKHLGLRKFFSLQSKVTVPAYRPVPVIDFLIKNLIFTKKHVAYSSDLAPHRTSGLETIELTWRRSRRSASKEGLKNTSGSCKALSTVQSTVVLNVILNELCRNNNQKTFVLILKRLYLL